MYALTSIRSDIAFAVGKLSRYTSNPSKFHWHAIRRVLEYLKKTQDYGLSYSGYPLVIEGYSDASWITDKEDYASTSGWIYLLGGGAVSWTSKKQTCITEWGIAWSSLECRLMLSVSNAVNLRPTCICSFVLSPQLLLPDKSRKIHYMCKQGIKTMDWLDCLI